MAEAVKRLWDISQNEELRELLRVQERERMDRAGREETVRMKGEEKGREEASRAMALKLLNNSSAFIFRMKRKLFPHFDTKAKELRTKNGNLCSSLCL